MRLAQTGIMTGLNAYPQKKTANSTGWERDSMLWM
jgi:hypothetical protein